MRFSPECPPGTPELKFVAAVALRFDTPLSVGETPDGVRLDFQVHGTVTGPELKGRFPSCAAYLLIDADGVGLINVRAPLLLDDGAVAELESTGRYDFGDDGYKRAVAGDLPNSALGWCPRFLTAHPRYQWLNRTLFLGVGELVPSETRVDYDLYAMGPTPSVLPAAGPSRSGQRSLYDRLGGRERIQSVVNDFVAALMSDQQLHRQNPKVAAAHQHVNADSLKSKVGDVFSRLAGGPVAYTGKPLRAAHAPLDISEADWTLAGEHLVNILRAHAIPQREQDDLLAAIGSTKWDIVKPSAAG